MVENIFLIEEYHNQCNILNNAVAKNGLPDRHVPVKPEGDAWAFKGTRLVTTLNFMSPFNINSGNDFENRAYMSFGA